MRTLLRITLLSVLCVALLLALALAWLWPRYPYAPERLLYSRVDMSPANWNDWLATRAVEVLRPELPWEGSELPLLSSIRGEMSVAGNELRDPYVFRDEDGKLYLYYIGAGEQAMGVALLHPHQSTTTRGRSPACRWRCDR